jgi:hypothetical protein
MNTKPKFGCQHIIKNYFLHPNIVVILDYDVRIKDR